MCGITGILDYQKTQAIDEKLFNTMVDSLSHRGPDARGVFFHEHIAFGHRRLSVIDLKQGGQPMFSNDKKTVLVFNGEIYNFKSLAAELAKLGHRFYTSSDSEVLLKAWQEWGVDCVQHLRGMFAFAIWDVEKQSLFLARDRLGIKPLFYGLMPNGELLFASELKPFYLYDGLSKTLREDAVCDYFSLGYIPDPKTIFQSVHKLPPGHTLQFTPSKNQGILRRYWDVNFSPCQTASAAQLEEELISRLNEATQIRTVADVPLGSFLSGGVDSSAITALLANSRNQAVNTFSIGSPAKAFDESGYAHKVAKLLGTDAELAYSGAMLQDFLLPMLTNEKYAEYIAFLTLQSTSPCGLVDFEQKKFGWNHCRAAAHIMTAWKFPDDIICCVLLHHRGLNILTDEKLSKTAAAAVAVSALIPCPMQQVPGGMQQLFKLANVWKGFDLIDIAKKVDVELREIEQRTTNHISLIKRCEKASLIKV